MMMRCFSFKMLKKVMMKSGKTSWIMMNSMVVVWLIIIIEEEFKIF